MNYIPKKILINRRAIKPENRKGQFASETKVLQPAINNFSMPQHQNLLDDTAKNTTGLNHNQLNLVYNAPQNLMVF
jgi:hypothetical protein